MNPETAKAIEGIVIAICIAAIWITLIWRFTRRDDE